MPPRRTSGATRINLYVGAERQIEAEMAQWEIRA